MRLLTTLLLLCTFILPGHASELEYTFGKASKLEVHFFPTNIVKSNRRFVTITCPSWAVKKFDVQTRNGVLYIGFKNEGSKNTLNTYEFSVVVHTPEPFSEISASVGASVDVQTPYPSSANLTIDASVGSKASLYNQRLHSLNANCRVGSVMVLNNISASGRIDIEANTSGQFAISGIKAHDLKFGARVSSSIIADGIDAGNVRVDAGVQSSVTLRGRCDNLDAETTGYGTKFTNHMAVRNSNYRSSSSSGSSGSYSSSYSSSSSGKSSSRSSSRSSSSASSSSAGKSKTTRERRYHTGNGNIYIYDETTDTDVTVPASKNKVNITSGSKSAISRSRSKSRSSSSGNNGTSYIEIYSDDANGYNQNNAGQRYRNMKWNGLALSGNIDVVYTVSDDRNDVTVHGNATVSNPNGLLTVRGKQTGGDRQIVEIKGPAPTAITMTDGARLDVKNAITVNRQFTLSASGSSEADFKSIDAPAIVIDARQTSTVRVENQISNSWSGSNKNRSSNTNTIWIALDDASRIEAGSLIGRSVEITAEGSSDAEAKAIAADLTTVTAAASGQINIEDVRADLLTYDIDSTSTVYIRKAVLGKAAGDNDGTLTFVSRQITGKSNASSYVSKNPKATTRSRTTQHPSRSGSSRPANKSTTSTTTTSRGTRILP